MNGQVATKIFYSSVYPEIVLSLTKSASWQQFNTQQAVFKNNSTNIYRISRKKNDDLQRREKNITNDVAWQEVSFLPDSQDCNI